MEYAAVRKGGRGFYAPMMMRYHMRMKPITLQNTVGHFRTITHHKLLVMQLMIRLGLVWQGINHDNSKYSPIEFWRGVRYFQGTRSPNAAEREDLGYTEAWMHHKGRNRHHFEYWMDIGKKPAKGFRGMPMPTRYIVEMFCDRVAACKVYQQDAYTDASPLQYFLTHEYNLMMHPDTAAMLEVMLRYLADNGEEAAIEYIRENIVKPRFCYGEGARF